MRRLAGTGNRQGLTSRHDPSLQSTSRWRKQQPVPRGPIYGRWLLANGPLPPPPRQAAPLFIPFDGPADVAYETMQASMYAGELFGEAGCLDGLPRSATVVARLDWYMLEMVRNVLVEVQRDDGYQSYWDDLYKRRGLGIQLRRFSIFNDLEDDQFNELLRNGVADMDSNKPVAGQTARSGELQARGGHLRRARPLRLHVHHPRRPGPGRQEHFAAAWDRTTSRIGHVLCAALVAGELEADGLRAHIWHRLALVP